MPMKKQLTQKQKEQFKEHSKHHTPAHIRRMKKEIIATLLAVSVQFFAVVWYISKMDSKINILYDKYETESEMEVVENQVKMKLDLANLMEDMKAIKKELKKSRNKDKEIMEQHDQIFELLQNNSNVPNNYSYGD